MTSFWRETNWLKVQTKNKSLKESLKFREPKCKVHGCSFFCFSVLFFVVFFSSCCSNFVRMESMLWIEDVIESTPTPSFLTNSTIDMADFVDPHKVVIKRSAFSAFPSAQDENENKRPKNSLKEKKKDQKLSYSSHISITIF